MMYKSEYPVCPRCKSKNYIDFYDSNSKSEHQYCYYCGYYRDYKMIKGNGECCYTKSDDTLHITSEIFAGEEIMCENPFGAFCVIENNEDEMKGTLETKDDYEEFVSDAHIKKHNFKKAIVSRLIDGKIVKEVIFPKTV